MSDPVEDHHKKRDVVYNRPDYRDARWERATKVRPAMSTIRKGDA